MLSLLLNPLAVFLSLSTLLGIVVHDTRIDKAASVALTLPAALASYDNAKLVHVSDLHTHVERSSFAQAAHAISVSPGLQPRVHEDKKHLLQQNVPKGHHPFDNYTLPLV